MSTIVQQTLRAQPVNRNSNPNEPTDRLDHPVSFSQSSSRGSTIICVNDSYNNSLLSSIAARFINSGPENIDNNRNCYHMTGRNFISGEKERPSRQGCKSFPRSLRSPFCFLLVSSLFTQPSSTLLRKNVFNTGIKRIVKTGKRKGRRTATMRFPRPRDYKRFTHATCSCFPDPSA